MSTVPRSNRRQRPVPEKAPERPTEVDPLRLRWLYPALLLGLLLAVYCRVATFPFVNFDDPDYTFQNPHVRDGITLPGLAWAFTSFHAANWHPLTWMSHMLDFEIFGARSGAHHVTNLLLHVACSIILFFLLCRMTKSRWCSLLVAFGFAFHPLHVESVAWIAERKDLLGALFFLLSLSAYVTYALQPSPRRYLWVVLLFCCALLSKQMAVTLPAVAMALDFWPLRRPFQLRDKIPLAALAAAAIGVAFFAQRQAGAVASFEEVPLFTRLANVPVGYVTYLFQFLWPMNLSVYYPYHAALVWWQPVCAIVALVAISLVAWRQRIRRPYLLAGWCWYLITLLPVIGIVQIGAQAHADRYTYLPLVGIFIALAWWLQDVPQKFAYAVAIVVGLSWPVLTWMQVGYWRDSVALFEHATQVTDGNYLAYNNLGEALSKQPGKLDKAIGAYKMSVSLEPRFAPAHYNLGTTLLDAGRRAEAVPELEAAIRLDSRFAKARNNLGRALAQDSVELPAAIENYQASVAGNPTGVESHVNLANAFARQGRMADAVREYHAALQIDSSNAVTHFDLANLLVQMDGELANAIAEYRRAIQIKPDYAAAYNNLGSAVARDPAGRADAIQAFERAIKADPQYAEAHFNLANAFAQNSGRMTEAMEEWRRTLRINPRHVRAHYNLGIAMAQMHRTSEAIEQIEAAYEIEPSPEILQVLDQLRGGR